MCAIAGGHNRGEVEQMLETMKHRAPDGSRVIDGKFCMGMGRLAIIDLKSTGLFPYQYRDHTISFNGEIYNYIELRKELKKLGWKFETESDIEVCLKAYLEWGVKCLDKFNGMFALAIYDGKRVFLARDIAGEKPLYYTPKSLKFASEAKCLKNPKELLPAHYMFWEDGYIKTKRYWYPRHIIIKNPEKELERLLEDAIKIRTRADVPYGLYLSGGVDSSLINTFHKFKHTFTYEDKDYREEFLKIFPKILWHLDYPIKSFSAFGLWKLAEEASKKVRVVISGEGADELFGGYIRYIKPHFNHVAQLKYPSYAGMFKKAKSVSDQGWDEFNGNLRELLRMGDRMASAWGVENRCPFLDKRIIEFAFSLPDEYKINGLDTKVILNRILRKRNKNYQPIEKAGLYCSIPEWLGGTNKLDKKAYISYQKSLWRKKSQ